MSFHSVDLMLDLRRTSYTTASTCTSAQSILSKSLPAQLSYCKMSVLTPFTDLTDPATLHNLLRLVMIIATYLLFRPYLSQFIRHISGAPDTREEQMKARVASMVEEQEKAKKKS